MKKYYPDYYKNFRCLAGACTDTCCASWEICIDDDTLEYYRSVKGEFGKRLNDSITSDPYGDAIFILNGKRCPFLNKDNLCDIHINLGEAHTCEVCREHPRFSEIYDGFTEISLSASCPAANDIIFNAPLSWDTYPFPEYGGNDGLLSALLSERNKLFSLISGSESLTELALHLRQSAVEVSECFYDYNDSYDRFYSFSAEVLCGFESFLLNESEILTDEWRQTLYSVCRKELPDEVFYKFCSDNVEKIKKAFAYFVYRYFFKAVNDESPELNSAFIALCVFVCVDISAKTNTDFAQCVRIFSKETEHDTENIELIKAYIEDKGR